MTRLSHAVVFVFIFTLSACSEHVLMTGLDEKPVAPEFQFQIDTSQPARLEPISTLSPEIKRQWCEMRLRDIQAGKPPLGETAPNQLAAGNSLCLQWFGKASLAGETQ